MAKSKKALKALKRRKQAKERSRALKMRQDYTGGGRVKAQRGGFPSALPEGVRNAVEEARKAAEEQEKEAEENQKVSLGRGRLQVATRQGQQGASLGRGRSQVAARQGQQAQVQTTPTAPVQQSVTPTPTVTSEPVTQQIQEAVTPTAPTQPTTPIQQQPVVAADTTPTPEKPYFGTRYDGEKDFTADDYGLIKSQGGDPNNDGIISNDEWANWMLSKGPTEGFEANYKRKLQEVAEIGALRPETREKINQRLASPPTQPTTPVPDDRELYTDPRLAEINNPDNTEKFYDSGEDNIETDTVNDNKGSIKLNELSFTPQENELFNLNMDKWNAANQRPEPITASFNQQTMSEDKKITSEYLAWRSKKAAFHNNVVKNILKLDRVQDTEGNITILPVSGTEFRGETVAPYKIPAMSADPVSDIPVERVVDQQTGTTRTKAETFEIDRFERDAQGNIQFDEAGNPIRALRDVAPISDDDKVGVEDIAADTVVTKDDPATPEDEREIRLTAPAKVKTNAELLGVEEKAIRGFLAAESNYFNKYPEVRDAIRRGEATDIFDFQWRIGEEKGYTLDFEPTEYAAGTVERLAEASEAELTRTRAAERDAQQEREALARQPEFIEDTRSQIDPVTGERVVLSATREAEKQSRQAILDETAAQGTEALIQGTVGYEAAERRELKGEAAKGDARSLLQEVGEIPAEISEAILENPAQVTAQVDTEPVEVQAAIAALPNEALVSVQLENLLAGIDEGVTPTWARPAVQLVESRLNARGLNVSTVGRDALFNAIIQTALPIAQSNAAALQQRANQNLSNEQQANLQQSSQEMQLRLNNLANRQASGSQSAQLAQQINLTQGQFTQQAQLTESEQAQQVRLQSLQNEQQAAMANLGNDQQIELANLQVEAQRLGANQSAVNQERLAEMQVAANFLEKNAAFKQQMEVANLSSEQQMRLAFLTAKNQAEAQNLTAAQQTELANLSSRLEVNKISATLAQQMNLAQLNVDQQTAIRNAATVANIDLTKFSASQQIELSNSKFIQTSTLQDLNNRQQVILQDATALASMDLAEADALTKVSIENARNFLSLNMSNLNNEQQAYVLDSQQRQQRLLSDAGVQNAVRQFNSSSDLQTQQFVTSLAANLNQFNSQQVNALEQFNAAESNRVEAINAGNELQAEQFMAQIQTQIRQFNSQQDMQIEQFNTANTQAIEQSNVEWRRKANLADSAAQNAANQQQAAFQFDLDKTSLSQAWQTLRDQAVFDMQEYQNDKERKISAINAIVGNEAFMTDTKYSEQRKSLLDSLDAFSESIKEADFEFELTPELRV